MITGYSDQYPYGLCQLPLRAHALFAPSCVRDPSEMPGDTAEIISSILTDRRVQFHSSAGFRLSVGIDKTIFAVSRGILHGSHIVWRIFCARLGDIHCQSIGRCGTDTRGANIHDPLFCHSGGIDARLSSGQEIAISILRNSDSPPHSALRSRVMRKRSQFWK